MPETSPLRKKVTLSAIAALPPESTLWDTEIKGFCIRRQRSAADRHFQLSDSIYIKHDAIMARVLTSNAFTGPANGPEKA